MALSIRVIRLQAPATNINQDYTISGFGPVDAVICFAGIAGDDSDLADCNMSTGFWDTSNTVCWSAVNMDAIAIASDSENSHETTSFIVEMQDEGGDAVIRSASITAVTNGIRLAWLGSDLTSRPYVMVIIINGINGAQAGSSTPNVNDNGTVQVTTSGITPKLIFGGQNRALIGGGFSTRKNHSFGFAYDDGGTTRQRTIGWQYQGFGVSQGVQGAWDTGFAMRLQVGVYHVQSIADGDFNVGNFIHTTLDPDLNGDADGSDLYYLALDFDEDCAVFTSSVPTSTGNWVPLTGGSFTPQAVLILPQYSTTINDEESGGDSGFMGWYFADETNEYQLGFNDEDGVASFTNASGKTNTQLWNSNEFASVDFEAHSPVFGSGSITYLDANVIEAGKASQFFGIAFESGSPVVITDVDGDEAWNDGDTGLVITGTGFV